MIDQSNIVTIGVIAFVLITLLVGAIAALMDRNSKRFTDAITKIVGDKNVKDEAERRYLESSLTTQDFVHMLHSVVTVLGAINLPLVDSTIDDVGEFLEEVTDGVVNADAVNEHIADTKPLPDLTTK